MVAVANDITFNLGSFSPQEDAVFRSATEHALEARLPIVYLAANSGARVGLAEEVKQRLQVSRICVQCWTLHACPASKIEACSHADGTPSDVQTEIIARLK